MAIISGHSGEIGENVFVLLEKIGYQNDWKIDNWCEEAALVYIEGPWQEACVNVSWQSYADILTFTIPLEFKISKTRSSAIRTLLCAINEILFVGHFELSAKNRNLALCYSLIVTDTTQVQEDHLQRTLAILNDTVQKFYPSFKMMQRGSNLQDSLNAAIIEPLGHA